MPLFQIGQKTLPTKAQLEAEKKKKEAAQAQKREAKAKAASTQTRKRRSETEALLFGQELFEPIAKREKEIVIHFPARCNIQGIYISRCGKFGYRRTDNQFYFDLFYFVVAIEEGWKDDLEIIPSDDNWLFDSLTPEELEDVAIRLKRAEYAAEKQRLLEEIKEQERLRKIENEKIDAEYEAQQEKEEAQQELPIESINEVEETKPIETKEEIGRAHV